MRTHELKIWPRYFDDVLSGAKRYEVRINDRDYKVGDRLVLLEWEPRTRLPTGRTCEAGIVHISYYVDMPLALNIPQNVCVMGIELLP